MICFSLSPEQKELVLLVRSVVEEHIMPHALLADKQGDNVFDWGFVNLLAEHNLLALSIPEEYGGRNLDFLSMALVVEEIARGCAGLAACLVGELHAVIPILNNGTKKQKETYLPKLTSPKANLAAFALTEPKGGSDVKNLNTTIRMDNNRVSVNGIKDHIINGATASFSTVCASTETNRGRTSFRFVLVPQEKIRVGEIRNKMGIRYSNTAQIIFDNTEVDKDDIIGSEGIGYLLLNQTLDSGRALIAAIELGIARAAYETILNFAQQRIQFGKPIIENQGVSFPLVEMATLIDAARFMVWRACWLIDQGSDYTKASSMARLYCAYVAEKVTSKAINIMGASGYAADSLLNVFFRDAKAGDIVGGTDNIQKMIIASLL